MERDDFAKTAIAADVAVVGLVAAAAIWKMPAILESLLETTKST